MTYIDDTVVTVQAFIDGGWVDLTQDNDNVDGHSRIRGTGVSIKRGKSPRAQRTGPDECQFVIHDRDGQYSNRNPRSPYAGKLGLNTPVRVILDPFVSYLRFPERDDGNYAYAADSATLDITGDITIRIDMFPEELGVHSFNPIYKYDGGGNQRSWAIFIDSDAYVWFYWSPDGTLGARRGAVSTAPITSVGRFCLQVSFDANNGAGGITVNFSIGDDINGPFTALGSPVTAATTSSIYASTANVNVANGLPISDGTGIPFKGRVYNVELYNDTAATSLVAGGYFSFLELDQTSYSDGTTTWVWGNPVVLGSDSVRFSGKIPSWPITWDSSGTDVHVAATAYGIFKQLNDGAKALDSAMTRYYSSLTSNIGYWPGEDEEGATFIAAKTPGVQPARQINLDFGAATDLPGSAPLFKLTDSSVAVGTFPSYTGTGALALTFVWYADAYPAVDTKFLSFAFNSGYVDLALGTATYNIAFYDTNGTLLSSATAATGAGTEPGNWLCGVIELEQSGGNVAWAYNWRAQDVGIGYSATGSYAGTVPQVLNWRAWAIGASANLNEMSLGHIAASTSVDDYLEGDHLASFKAYVGERAIARLRRTAGEEGIDFIAHGKTDYSPPMGPQPRGTLLDVWDECAAVDRGILAGRRDVYGGVLYIGRQVLENAPRLPIAYTDSILSDGLTPDEDNPNLQNDVTVKRKGGSSSRSVTTTGPRSVDAIGTYTEGDTTLSLYTDDQTSTLAGAIRHLGSWDELRWSGVGFELARPIIYNDIHLYERLLALDLGSALSISDMPDWLPARDAEILVEQYTETLTKMLGTLTFDTTYARVYNTPVLTDGGISLIGSEDSVLDADVGTSDTTIDVAGDSLYTRWTYTADFDIEVSGLERMTVTGISGSAPPYTFTVTRGVNLGGTGIAHSADAEVKLWDQRYVTYN